MNYHRVTRWEVMLGQRRTRWANIEPALGYFLVFVKKPNRRWPSAVLMLGQFPRRRPNHKPNTCFSAQRGHRVVANAEKTVHLRGLKKVDPDIFFVSKKRSNVLISPMLFCPPSIDFVYFLNSDQSAWQSKEITINSGKLISPIYELFLSQTWSFWYFIK